MSELLDIEIDGDEATVTWLDDTDTEHTTTCSLDFQPEERDVGVSAGFNVHTDIDFPRAWLDRISDKAMQCAIEDYEDRCDFDRD